MKSLIAAILIALSLTMPALATTPAQILDAPAAVLERYSGQEMEFAGVVISCTRTFGGLWAVRINAGEVDVIGYARDEVPVGQSITMRGTCVAVRNDPRIVVVLNPAMVMHS